MRLVLLSTARAPLLVEARDPFNRGVVRLGRPLHTHGRVSLTRIKHRQWKPLVVHAQAAIVRQQATPVFIPQGSGELTDVKMISFASAPHSEATCSLATSTAASASHPYLCVRECGFPNATSTQGSPTSTSGETPKLSPTGTTRPGDRTYRSRESGAAASRPAREGRAVS